MARASASAAPAPARPVGSRAVSPVIAFRPVLTQRTPTSCAECAAPCVRAGAIPVAAGRSLGFRLCSTKRSVRRNKTRARTLLRLLPSKYAQRARPASRLRNIAHTHGVQRRRTLSVKSLNSSRVMVPSPSVSIPCADQQKLNTRAGQGVARWGAPATGNTSLILSMSDLAKTNSRESAAANVSHDDFSTSPKCCFQKRRASSCVRLSSTLDDSRTSVGVLLMVLSAPRPASTPSFFTAAGVYYLHSDVPCRGACHRSTGLCAGREEWETSRRCGIAHDVVCDSGAVGGRAALRGPRAQVLSPANRTWLPSAESVAGNSCRPPVALDSKHRRPRPHGIHPPARLPSPCASSREPKTCCH